MLLKLHLKLNLCCFQVLIVWIFFSFFLHREWNERHDGEGAGEGEDDSREDVLWAESQASGDEKHD